MAALQRPVTSGFPAQPGPGAMAFFEQDGAQVKCTVTFVVLDDQGAKLDLFPCVAENTGWSFSFYNAAFRAAAWTAYKVANGYTEVP